jgi:CelD/BcsL family acetyltransferase involved in cellulose biosynthesis
MRVFCATSLDDLAPYADDWDRLAAGVPFRGWTWLSHWWRVYGPQTEADALRTRLAMLCVADDTNALMGVAPWYLDSSALHGRVLRPLGSGEVCSDYLSVLCHPSAEEAVVDAMSEYLVENARSDAPDALRWDRLELGSVDAEDRAMAGLVNGLAALGCTVHRRQGVNCWRLALPTDWNEYVASLGRNVRRDIRRLDRDLLQSGRATFHNVATLDQLAQAMDILVELHQRRHETLGQGGCFASPRFMAFHRGVVPELFRRGQVHFCWLEVDRKPVAAEYQLVEHDVLYAYQAGIDPASLTHQPGKLIYMAILRQAIEHGYRAFDFLRGDEPYKARFGAVPRPTVDLRIVPQRTVAQLRHNLWLAGDNVKQWVKREIRGDASRPPIEILNTEAIAAEVAKAD